MMKSNSTVSILLIENDPEDGQHLESMLTGGGETAHLQFAVTVAENLQTALQRLADHSFDLALLDLQLPDSQHIEPFVKIHEQAPDLPLIVMTDVEDENFAIKLVQMGAQDYLVKETIHTTLLIRSIRYAIERHRMQGELEQTRREEQHEREFRSLEHLSQPVNTTVTARLFGATPLRESLPDLFNELVQRYGHLLDIALEQRTYKVDYELSEDLRLIAEQLGFLKASPRDVVKMHSTALKRKTTNAAPQKVQAYVEEGRLMVLELMGYLVSYYRNYALGISTRAPTVPKKKTQEGGGA